MLYEALKFDFNWRCLDEKTSVFEINFATYQSLSMLVKLPNLGWMWSFDNSAKSIFCSNVNLSPSGKFVMKSVQVLKSQKVAYILNGRQISSKDLPRCFSSIEKLSALIVTFGEKSPCNGILDHSLHTVKMSSKLSCYWDPNSGILRSTKCAFVSDKINLCEKCRQLKTYLRRKQKYASHPIPIPRPKFRCCLSTQKKQAKLDNCRRRIRCLESKAKVKTASKILISSNNFM